MPTEAAAEFSPWTPDSWRRRAALQQPDYPDPAALDRALAELRLLPPLVTSWEVVMLREQLAEAAVGRGFVLQGGALADWAGNTPSRGRLISRRARAFGCSRPAATWSMARSSRPRRARPIRSGSCAGMSGELGRAHG